MLPREVKICNCNYILGPNFTSSVQPSTPRASSNSRTKSQLCFGLTLLGVENWVVMFSQVQFKIFALLFLGDLTHESNYEVFGYFGRSNQHVSVGALSRNGTRMVAVAVEVDVSRSTRHHIRYRCLNSSLRIHPFPDEFHQSSSLFRASTQTKRRTIVKCEASFDYSRHRSHRK